jgi:hypothetical protein
LQGGSAVTFAASLFGKHVTPCGTTLLTAHVLLPCAAKRNWLRIPAILYGSFVSATMLPILAELITHTGECGPAFCVT